MPTGIAIPVSAPLWGRIYVRLMEVGEEKGTLFFMGRSETPLFLGRLPHQPQKQPVFLFQNPPKCFLIVIEEESLFHFLLVNILIEECMFDTIREKIKQNLFQFSGH